ncbi:MAG: glycosyltransferase family 2 protein [Alphaproteobacteria bacterium]
MIVKNEAHIIRRCLESVLPLVDYISIADTGSTDGTQSLIRDFLEETGTDGQVVDMPWRDFAYNRTASMQALRSRVDVDYGFWLDADEVAVFEPGFDAAAFKQSLRWDVYEVETFLNDISFLLPRLTRNRIEFCYKGVLHEYLECPQGTTRGRATGLSVRGVQDSARNQNPEKYRIDAHLLTSALQTETDPFLVARYTFYLAQSLRNANDLEPALTAFLKRAELGYWAEEVFLCYYYAAQIKEQLVHADTEIIGMYLKAFEACPTRAESLHGAAKYCRVHGKNRQGYLFAKQALGIRCPENGLFVQKWIYDYGLLDEYSVVAYWCGNHMESLEATIRLLEEANIPPSENARIKGNADFALERLREKAFLRPDNGG